MALVFVFVSLAAFLEEPMDSKTISKLEANDNELAR
jgi:hypothetical protein